MDNNFKIELIEEYASFQKLAGEWNPLLGQSSANGVFLTWEYLTTWWEAYGTDYELYVLAARNDSDELVGVAPMMIGKGHCFPRKHFRHLTFLGGLGDSVAEYQDFVIAKDSEKELIPVFFEKMMSDLNGKWDVFLLPLVQEDSPSLNALLGTVPQFGGHTVQLSSRPSPHIPLPASWDEFIKSKSKNFKKQFNNQWNRVHKNHELEWLEAGKDLSIEESIDILMELNLKRWGDEGKTFKSEVFTAFHRKLATTFQEKGWLYFRILRLDGQFAAVRYDFVYDNKLWNYQNGWLPELGKLSLGKMLIGHSVKWCIDEGLREYDFLAGDTAYKKSWATQTRHLMNVEISNPTSARAFAFQGLRNFRSYMEARKKAA